VTDALAAGRAVVALESTILAHGLPGPANRALADQLETAVRAHGAVPATVAVLDGVARVGLCAVELDRVCAGDLVKLSVRDLGVAVGLGRDGATTVAATAALASAAGVAVFATGGLGGVHRGARDSWDVSADLAALARTGVLVVCSGVKSILDVPATLEVLETESVPVLGYRTDVFPGFYRRDSGHAVPWRIDSPTEAADVWRAHTALGSGAGAVLAQPVPEEAELDADLHDRLLTEGLALLAERGITGKDVTPALLEHFHAGSAGASLHANVELVVANAELAAQVAVALTT
jgi:pseudouridine-5'-phosphate glycosidase